MLWHEKLKQIYDKFSDIKTASSHLKKVNILESLKSIARQEKCRLQSKAADGSIYYLFHFITNKQQKSCECQENLCWLELKKSRNVFM